MNRDLKLGYIGLVLVSFFWGTTYIASKIGTKYMPGLYVAGVRQFLSGFIMVAYFLLRGYKIPSLPDLKKMGIQGFFLLSLANGLLTWALEYISSGLGAIIAALVPLSIALFSIWLTKSARITKWMVVGLVAGLAGVVIIFYDYIGQLNSRSFILGVVMALLSVVAWSFGTVYTSGQKTSVGLLYSAGWQMLIAGIITLIACFVTGKHVSLLHTTAELWYALLYLIFFGSILGYSAYVLAITKLPPTQVSVYAYINPIVAVFFGWVLLNERMTAHMILGTMITVGGIYIVNREFKKQQK